MVNLPSLLRLWGVGIVLILLAYFFVDRSVSTFIYTHHWALHLAFLKHIVEWPPLISSIAPFLFLIAAWKKQKMLLLLSLSVMLTYLLKNDCKWIFSRYWPETWTHDNLSWISNQAYGFQWFQGKPFQGTDLTGSFPSGHASVAFATLLPIGLYYRRLLKYCVALASLEALSMVAFDYHFVSDVIAGTCLGITCALLCYRLLNPQQP